MHKIETNINSFGLYLQWHVCYESISLLWLPSNGCVLVWFLFRAKSSREIGLKHRALYWICWNLHNILLFGAYIWCLPSHSVYGLSYLYRETVSISLCRWLMLAVCVCVRARAIKCRFFIYSVERNCICSLKYFLIVANISKSSKNEKQKTHRRLGNRKSLVFISTCCFT